MVTWVDDLGSTVTVVDEVHRVVSLVPSLTETVAASRRELLVGATDWCSHPADLDVTRIGGTKNPDVAAIVALRPHLVLANQEENRLPDLDALRAAGVPVYVTDIRTVPDAFRSLGRLFTVLGVPTPEWFTSAKHEWNDDAAPGAEMAPVADAAPGPPVAGTRMAGSGAVGSGAAGPGVAGPGVGGFGVAGFGGARSGVVGPGAAGSGAAGSVVAGPRMAGSGVVGPRVVVPIWRRPWMALGSDTFAGDLVERLGFRNVLAESPERYPRFDPRALPPVDLVLLPDEPYAFTPDDGPEAFPGTPFACVDGRSLTWYGPSLAGARARLLARISTPR